MTDGCLLPLPSPLTPLPPSPPPKKTARARDRVPEYLAGKLFDRLSALRRTSGDVLPPHDSCDCLIVDRGMDPIAPIIHEWTYEAMVYDLLPVSGSMYTYHAISAAGKSEEKQARGEGWGGGGGFPPVCPRLYMPAHSR